MFQNGQVNVSNLKHTKILVSLINTNKITLFVVCYSISVYKVLVLVPFCSATINPTPLPLPTVVPYARTPTGQGVDSLGLGGIIGYAEKENSCPKGATTFSSANYTT